MLQKSKETIEKIKKDNKFLKESSDNLEKELAKFKNTTLPLINNQLKDIEVLSTKEVKNITSPDKILV